MNAQKVRVEFVDGSGQGVGGVTVKATGCAELQTAPTGQAFFLVEDENFAVLANGKEVYQGRCPARPKKSRSSRTAATGKPSEWIAHVEGRRKRLGGPDPGRFFFAVPCRARRSAL